MKKIFLGLLMIIGTTFIACNDDDEQEIVLDTSNLTLDIQGLEDLGIDYVYEGWIIVNGSPITTGTFTVDANGSLSQTVFTVSTSHLTAATKFVLSIEPAVDTDPAPAATKILAGDFSNNTANVSSTAIVADFSSASGKYILATPTDGSNTNERSGVWFLDLSTGSPTTGLSLPVLPDGWKYEGWVVMNGIPVSTGTFTSVDMADDNAATSTFKGTLGDGPAYPGEDFIMNAPTGLTFPTDLRGTTVVISVEPYPDNSPNPFVLKPLAYTTPNDADDHVTLPMGTGPVTSITGLVTR